MNLTTVINTAQQSNRSGPEQGGRSIGREASVVRADATEKDLPAESSKPKSVIQPVEESVKVSLASQDQILENTTKKTDEADKLYFKPVQSGSSTIVDATTTEAESEIETQPILKELNQPQTTTIQSESNTQSDVNASKELSSADLQQIEQLKQRDREVRQHELAHAIGGGLTTGSPKYDYQTGPDGKRYAVSGEVSIKFSAGSDPEQQIAEAEKIKQAANAPAQPSAQDRTVAAEATQRIAAAQKILQVESLDSAPDASLQAERNSSVSDIRDQKVISEKVSPREDAANAQAFVQSSIQTLQQQNAKQESIQPSIKSQSTEIEPNLTSKKTTLENAQVLFDKQRQVAARLQENREANTRDFGGSAGSNSISANFAPQATTPSIQINEQAAITQVDSPQSSVGELSQVSNRATAISSQAINPSVTDAPENSPTSPSPVGLDAQANYDKAQGSDVDIRSIENTTRRANIVVSEQARLNQNLGIGAGQAQVYERNLKAIDAEQQRSQEPGGIFTAIV